MAESHSSLDRPFYSHRGDYGVLILHGFGDSPARLLPLCETLAENGFTVCAPLLPGPSSHARRSWEEAFYAARQAHARLLQDCRAITILGLSEGAWLSLLLAGSHIPDGVICIAPAPPPRFHFPTFSWARLTDRALSSLIRATLSSLYAVSAPLLIACQEEQEPLADRILASVSSREHSLCTLPYATQLHPSGPDRLHLIHQILSFLQARQSHI